MTQSDFVESVSLTRRNPWLAVNLSMLLPGLGQWYAGQAGVGVVLTLGQLLSVLIVVWSLFSPQGNTLVGLVMLTPVAFIYLASLFEAYRSISGVSILSSAQQVRLSHDRWFAVFLCQLIPGWGQFYLEQPVAGGLFAASYLILMGIIPLLPSLAIVAAAISAIACYHAYRIAPKQSGWRLEVRYLVIVIMIVFLLRFVMAALPTWVGNQIQPFEIPSESMLPTLQKGDRILVHKVKGYHPQPEDLIVFRVMETNPSTGAQRDRFFVKRVMAIPGQTIQIQQGMVYRDQQIVPEPYIAEPPAYNWGPIYVPPDYYVVLGDNRNDSFDSHVWGLLHGSRIVGKAYKIYLPFNRIKPL